MAKKKDKAAPTADEMRRAEIEFRRYVRKDGKFRKDLPKEQKDRAERLREFMGKKSLEWDESIIPVK